MKSILSKVVYTTAIVCFATVGLQAKSTNYSSSKVTSVALGDTGKMKMDKMKKKKMSKMSKSKMDKKMAKDSAGKM